MNCNANTHLANIELCLEDAGRKYQYKSIASKSDTEITKMFPELRLVTYTNRGLDYARILDFDRFRCGICLSDPLQPAPCCCSYRGGDFYLQNRKEG